MATLSGAQVDRKLTISWPKSDPSADVAIYPVGALAEGDGQIDSSMPQLAFVPNMYRRLELLGENPISFIKSSQAGSSEIIEAIEDEHRMEARRAIDKGAAGVFYEVHGADATQCTPMEYGGLFLERDRAFLDYVADAYCNVVYINGKEPYLDFVSDLPADVFAWDARGSQLKVSEVRKIRQGLLAADDQDADVPMPVGESTTDFLKGLLTNV